jgi:hypothetical protein
MLHPAHERLQSDDHSWLSPATGGKEREPKRETTMPRRAQRVNSVGSSIDNQTQIPRNLLTRGWAHLLFDPLIALRDFPIGPDKEAFHRYLHDFEAEAGEAELLNSLRDCCDLLPRRYAELLALPAGSTYCDAVALLLSHWTTTLRASANPPFD